MTNIINATIDALTPVIVDFVIGLVGILFALLLSKLRKIAALENVTDALEVLEAAIVKTVYSNQQVLVDDLKAAASDGKLTPDEVAMLQARTLEKVKSSVGPSVIKCILAAGIDLDNYILDTAEAVIHEIKTSEKSA